MQILHLITLLFTVCCTIVAECIDSPVTPELREPAENATLPLTQAPIGSQQDESLSITVTKGACDSICSTPGCVHTASKFLKSMDINVNPCDDFYRFACGGFLKDMIPGRLTDVLKQKVRTQLKIALAEHSEPTEPEPFRMAKNLYKSCMDNAAIEAQGTNSLLKFLNKHGGWPALTGTRRNDTFFNCTQYTNSVAESRNETCPADILFNFEIGPNFNNNTGRVLYLWQSTLGLDRNYLINGVDDPKVKDYYSYMVDVAVILVANRTVAKEELYSALNFEIKLANISLPLSRDPWQCNPMTLSQLSESYPSIPWKAYLSRWLPPTIQVDANDVVLVSMGVRNFITSLEKLLKETPKRLQANYVMWRFVSTHVEFLNDRMREREFQYTGMRNMQPRWDVCVRSVSQKLGTIVGAQYVRKYFDEEAKTNVTEMISNIKTQFGEIITQQNWLDDYTKERALKKANAMISHVAYPDELRDNSKLEKMFRDLEISDEDYFHGILNATSFWWRYHFRKMREPFNRSDEVNHARFFTESTAVHYPLENSIQLYAGILQDEFFSKDRPRYLNYGGIGTVIGHEIAHGFDEKGIHFDENGNQVNWFSNSSSDEYIIMAQSILYQYGNYSAEQVGLKLDGRKTLGENIADNAGIKSAYLAYITCSKQNGKEKTLPGIGYTPRQMFWINTANAMCTVYSNETLKQTIVTDVHSPAEFRILGPLSNMPEFARDFHCPVGSKMNPVKKKSVW